MTEWEVVGVIVTLLGLITAIVAPILKLNSSVVTLNATANFLTDEMREFREGNHEAHRDIYGRLDKKGKILERHETQLESHEKTLENHERRISELYEKF